jgi:hypothetical protein
VFKDELFMHDLLTGKELKKFSIDIGTVLEITARKKQDFVILTFIFI